MVQRCQQSQILSHVAERTKERNSSTFIISFSIDGAYEQNRIDYAHFRSELEIIQKVL